MRTSLREQAIVGGIASVGILAIVFGSLLIGAILWPYSIETWAAYFGKVVSIPWYAGCILGIIPGLGQLSIPAALVTWVAMMVLL